MTTDCATRPVGDLIELVKAMRQLGAVQVVCDSFSVTFEPPMHTMPDFAPMPRGRPESADDVDDESRPPQATDELMSQQIAKRRRAVEAELFAAAEGQS